MSAQESILLGVCYSRILQPSWSRRAGWLCRMVLGGALLATMKPQCLQVASGCYSWTRQTLAGISKNWNVVITYFATQIFFMYLILKVILKQIPCCHGASVSLLVLGLLPHLPHKGTCCKASSAEGSRHPSSTSNKQHRENPSDFPSL